MKRLFKRLLVCVAIVLTALIVTLGVAIYYINGNPSYYRTYAWSSEERSRINADAVHKILGVQNKIAASHAAEVRMENPQGASSIELTLSQAEINAFLQHNFSQVLAPWVQEPGVYLKEGRIIFAGKLVSLDVVASVFLKPSVEPDGRIRVQIEKTLGGRLPLPDFIIQSRTEKVLDKINRSLPDLRQKARMDSTGRCNTSFVEASLAQSMRAILEKRPASPFLYFPNDNGVSLPMKIKNIRVHEESLSLTIEIPTPKERDEIRKTVLN